MRKKVDVVPEPNTIRSSKIRRRTYLSQSDVPSLSLLEALRVPKAINDNCGRAPTKPFLVAQALALTPSSGRFRTLCGSAIAYGLTEGGANAPVIQLSPLGQRIMAPTEEGDEHCALREAALRPRVLREFLTKYNNAKVPREDIARNVLEQEFKVPNEISGQTLKKIIDTARHVGFICTVKGSEWVDLDGIAASPIGHDESAASDDYSLADLGIPSDERDMDTTDTPKNRPQGIQRVFITHGRNTAMVQHIKKVLIFGGFEPVVAQEHETISKPVPQKVMDDMRACQAGIIHVGAEMQLLDQDGNNHSILNQNVLIEIGAAMELYPNRFILLVERGVPLPSNLQGLYEVRYEGDKLDGDATMKLLEACTHFREQ